MARSRTRSNLREDVRKRADIESATARFPDAELNEYIDQSIARLYTYLDRLDSSYYLSTQSISTSSGTNNYALHDLFWTLKRVSVAIGGSNITLRKFMPSEQDWLNTLAQWSCVTPPMYRVQGNRIYFSPTPNGTYTVTVNYTQTPQRMALDGDEFDGIAGFEEFVILDAAIKCKQKDSLDPSLLMAAKAEVEQWILSVCARDVAEPERIQDVQVLGIGLTHGW